jgi:hypothetical protein
VYNILEGSETDARAPEGQSKEPPCYHVLEGPYPEGVPVYDVLEGPESNEVPVYGSLDGQDPHKNNIWNMPDTRMTRENNRGYDDCVYDSVGDLITDTGDIYQQLNQNGQRKSDEYQALNYPNKTLNLTELNESHSEV